MKRFIFILFSFSFALPLWALELPSANSIMSLINQEREVRGIKRLSTDSRLIEAARAKAESLAKIESLVHTKSGTGIIWWPLKDAGYDYRLAGENLALNIKTPKEIVSSWMSSPSHRENILDPIFEDIGVAVVRGSFEGSLASYTVMYTAKPQNNFVLGATAESSGVNEDEIRELMNTIISLLKELLLIQKNANT